MLSIVLLNNKNTTYTWNHCAKWWPATESHQKSDLWAHKIKYALERGCLMQTSYFHVYFWPAVKWIFAIIITCSFHPPRKELRLFQLSSPYWRDSAAETILEGFWRWRQHIWNYDWQRNHFCAKGSCTICAARHRVQTEQPGLGKGSYLPDWLRTYGNKTLNLTQYE